VLFLLDTGRLDLGAQSFQATGARQNGWLVRKPLLPNAFTGKILAHFGAKDAVDICHGLMPL
jgi:hypothetical protein